MDWYNRNNDYEDDKSSDNLVCGHVGGVQNYNH